MGRPEKGQSCGLGRWRPGPLQRFATVKWFTVVYGLLGTVQAMAFVYFIATLTTLEKRFQIRSEITGILMSGNELSQIFLSAFLAYKGGKGNRPVWISWGVLFSSFSCFLLAFPHFIYGPGANALALTQQFQSFVTPATSREKWKPSLCARNGESKWENSSEICQSERGENSMLSLCLIFFSQFVLGVGTTLYVTLGQPYLDDNTDRQNTPKLLGTTMALRSAGPAGGFVLGYLCLNSYIEPTLTPVIEKSDPRWLGAWWLGWIILGTVMTIFSFLMASFPREIKSVKEIKSERGSETFSYECVAEKGENRENPDSIYYFSGNGKKESEEDGMLAAVKRVCRNPLLIFNNLTAVFYILGVSGYINFFARYSEVQYHQGAAFSSVVAGVSTIFSFILGFLATGFVISEFKPKETYLLLFNIFIASVYMAGEFGFLFLRCDGGIVLRDIDPIAGDSRMTINGSSCNSQCSCSGANYSPVCYEEGKVSFFSPCHAGCSVIQNATTRTYTNCTCLRTLTESVKEGPCDTDCMQKFVIFVALQCLIQMIGCSGRITNVLINYRAVEERDKPLAQGLCLFMISLLAFIPGPIIYGKVIDSTCIIWDDKCGIKGNCWVYDKEAFRIYLNATALCFTFGALICDVVVFYLGRNLKIYEETNKRPKS